MRLIVNIIPRITSTYLKLYKYEISLKTNHERIPLNSDMNFTPTSKTLQIVHIDSVSLTRLRDKYYS